MGGDAISTRWRMRLRTATPGPRSRSWPFGISKPSGHGDRDALGWPRERRLMDGKAANSQCGEVEGREFVARLRAELSYAIRRCPSWPKGRSCWSQIAPRGRYDQECPCVPKCADSADPRSTGAGAVRLPKSMENAALNAEEVELEACFNALAGPVPVSYRG